jgi:hypothetical protein
MENNQHSKGERNTSGEEATNFTNEQPGQQLPSDSEMEKMSGANKPENEYHSESSRPEKENETLGTP